MNTFFYLITWAAAGGLAGAVIGSVRNTGNGVIGFWLGVFLGPVGWLITALLPPRVMAPKKTRPLDLPHPKAVIDPLEEFEMRERVAQGPPPPPRRSQIAPE